MAKTAVPLEEQMETPPTEAKERLEGLSLRRHRTFLIASVLVWGVGALSTHRIGVWAGIGGAAVSLAIWGMLLDDRIAGDLRRPTPRLLGIGVLAGLFMLAVTYLGYGVVMAGIPRLHGATGELYRFFSSLPRPLIPLAVPAIIVSEEIVWRGRAQALFQESMKPYPAALAAAALYALAHAPIGSPLLAAVAFACGLFWGNLRAATGSIIPSLISHVIWDLFVMVLFPLTPPA
jgi:membrane protease YdiL (CAAX protease family)